MIRRWVWALAMMLAVAVASLSSAAFAQSEGALYAPAAGGTRLFVTGTGEVQVDADRAVISTAVEVRRESPADAQQALAEGFDRVTSALSAAGIEWTPGSYSLYPMWEYPRDGKSPYIVGYQARRELQVKVDDVTRAGEAVELLLESGIESVFNVSFTVADQESVRSEAIRRALEAARAQAEVVADHMGLRVLEVIQVSLGGQSIPRAFETLRMDAAAAMQPSPVEVRVSVDVEYLLGE